MRRAALGALVLGLTLTVTLTRIGAATAEAAHPQPSGPATALFPADFPKLVDHEWGFPLGGFGGIRRGAPLHHVPVIFVHGNNVDADDWYVVRDDFRAAGWSDQELWALSYNGKGGDNGAALTRQQPERDADHVSNAGVGAITDDTVNLPDLYDFILAVRHYTGSARFSIVGHSLGVTLARKVLKDHPELRGDLVAFVGIAGANHGTSLCPPGSEGNVASCDEIAAGTPWLAALNGPDGSDETYAPAKWLTIYNDDGTDPAYEGPMYHGSPTLKGADNRMYPTTYHNDLRVSPPIVAAYREFLEQSEKTIAALATPAAPASVQAASVTRGAPAATKTPRDVLAATGSDDEPMLLVALLVLGSVLACRATSRSKRPTHCTRPSSN